MIKMFVIPMARQTAEVGHAVNTRALSGATRLQSTMTYSATTNETLRKGKPLEEMPGPKNLPIIGNLHQYLPLIGNYYQKEWHECQLQKFEQFGPIVREVTGPNSVVVHLYDPSDMEIVHRNEGSYPKKGAMRILKAIRAANPDAYKKPAGLLVEHLENWQHVRSKIQKIVLRPQNIKPHLPQLNEIADDFLHRIRFLRTNNMQVPEFKNEIKKWTLESMAAMLFNKRFGCLSNSLTDDSMTMKWIRAINEFLELTANLELSPLPIWKTYPKLSPSFQKLVKAHEFVHKTYLKYVYDVISSISAEESSKDRNSAFIESILLNLEPGDAANLAVDMMQSSVDATTEAVGYALYHLAANPQAQKKLQEEVDRVLPNGSPVTAEAMNKIPYVRACLKESMRLNPVDGSLKRILEKDLLLSGYHIPANTPISMNYFVPSVQEKYFSDAHKFKPERWIADSSNSKTAESFAFQPFGFGPRTCIARRLVEMEIQTLLAKIMQNFTVENKYPELKIKFKLILSITNPLRFEFHDRRKGN